MTRDEIMTILRFAVWVWQTSNSYRYEACRAMDICEGIIGQQSIRPPASRIGSPQRKARSPCKEK